jgi:hypothetical protein
MYQRENDVVHARLSWDRIISDRSTKMRRAAWRRVVLDRIRARHRFRDRRAEGHIIVDPKEHVPSVHALMMAVQRGVWSLLTGARGRLRRGVVPDGGFSIGFDSAGSHAVIHLVPRRAGDRVELPECGEWIADVGVLA